MAEYTDAQKKQLLDLIAKWQEKLRLQHWRIVVDWNWDADDDCVLSIFVQPERHYAQIRIGSFFDLKTDAERENAVCHELIHCHAQPPWDTAKELLWELSPQARAQIQIVIERQFEQMVDALATSFVPLD